MDFDEQAKQVIAAAENQFRELIGAAAREGNYQAVETMTRWALVLKGIPDEKFSLPKSKSKAKTPKKKQRHRKTNPKLSKYPKFAKCRDQLVKIAWSKAKKAEYRHKSPQHVALDLAKVLHYKTESQSIVAMDEVLPIKSLDGGEIPDYQVYLSLAWLRKINAIEQKGREGYSRVELNRSVVEIANAAWEDLPAIEK